MLVAQVVWRRRGLGAAVALAGLLMACSSSPHKPAELEKLTPSIAGKVVWSERLSGVSFPLGAQAVKVDGMGQFVVAGDNGVVMALQADTGKQLWQLEVGRKLAAGVGSDGRRHAVVTQDNELVVIDSSKGSPTILWRKPLGGTVSTAPLVAGERVFVLNVDRAAQAFDALDGRKLWELRRPGEALTLAQAGVLAAYKDTLVLSQGPRLTGVDPLTGSVRWEAQVGSTRGTNEVERLADLVGPGLRIGDVLCARAFQWAVGCVDLPKGVLIWSRQVGGREGIGGDAELIFGADGADRLTAWRNGTGDVLWTNEQYLYRGLSAPLAVGKTVLIGDFEGYVHFLARDTGNALLRLSTDGSAIVGRPLAMGPTVLVVTRKGGLFAMRPE